MHGLVSVMPTTSTRSPSPAEHFTSSPYKLWPVASPATSNTTISQQGMLGHEKVRGNNFNLGCMLTGFCIYVCLRVPQLVSSCHSQFTNSIGNVNVFAMSFQMFFSSSV